MDNKLDFGDFAIFEPFETVRNGTQPSRENLNVVELDEDGP